MQLTIWNAIRNEHGIGSWAVSEGLLTVKTPEGSKTTQLGGQPPECLARLLMWELANERS
jgi:hypothetical protein